MFKTRSKNEFSIPSDNDKLEIIVSSSDPRDAQRKKDSSTSGGDDKIDEIAGRLKTETETAGRLKTETAGGTSKEELRRYALRGEWENAQSLFDKNPELVRIPLTPNGNTALHISVNSGRTEFVELLLKSKYITPQDLEIPNREGNTPLCIAAISGNYRVISKMVEMNQNLPLIRGYKGMLPVHLASFSEQQMAVIALTPDYILEKMSQNDIQRLFFMGLKSYMFVVAGFIFHNYPEMLVKARDEDDKLSALQILSRQRFDRINVDPDQYRSMVFLVQMVWEKVKELEYKTMLELIGEPCPVLIEALISENIIVVTEILNTNPELVDQKDSQGRTLLHIAALYRRTYFLYYMFTSNKGTVNLLSRAVDNDGNNALHFAARHSLESSLRSNATIRDELKWLKQMEEKFPTELRTMRNREGKTPEETFYTKEINDKIQNAANGIANSGMVVAALIATVVFAAALTVPGDKNDGWFYVFSFINAIALFASCASIISFLSIFTTTWFSPNKSIFPELSKLISFGLSSLFISIVTMIIAFAAAFFLIFQHQSKWVAYCVVALGLLPIIIFFKLQSSLFDGIPFIFIFSCWPLRAFPAFRLEKNE